MDADSKNRRQRTGSTAGVPNYRNDLLIDIIEENLPEGLEAWRMVAFAYQNALNQVNLWRVEDIRDNWVRKLCNNFKKPTGKPDELHDHIFCCISIERHIQDAANAAILGVSSAQSSHSADDDKSVLSKIDEDNTAVVAGGGMGLREDSAAGNEGSIQSSVGGDNKDDEKEVARANDAGTNVVDNDEDK